MAARTAISFLRPIALATCRLAILRHAISNTMATAPSSTRTAVRTFPVSHWRSGVTRTSIFLAHGDHLRRLLCGCGLQYTDEFLLQSRQGNAGLACAPKPGACGNGPGHASSDCEEAPSAPASRDENYCPERRSPAGSTPTTVRTYAIQLDHFADHIRRAAKSPLPQPVAENHRGRRAKAIFLLGEITADDRGRPEQDRAIAKSPSFPRYAPVLLRPSG